jgi:hypothetical protein
MTTAAQSTALVTIQPAFTDAERLEQAGRRWLSVAGIWESGRSDLSERHDEIIRGRLKRPA